MTQGRRGNPAKSAALGIAISLVGCTQQGQNPLYHEGDNARGALPEPRPVIASTAASVAPSPQRPEAFVPSRATLRMKTIVRHGHGCGGHCAFNRQGQSTVELTWTDDGHAQVRDDGDVESSTADPGGFSSTRRGWHLLWTGTWTGDATRRSIALERTDSSCSVSVQGRNRGASEACAGAPERLELQCAWEVPQADGPHAGEKRPESPRAWVCRGDPALDHYPGTDLPWAFAPTTIERRTVGEPRVETTYEVRQENEAR